MKQDAKEKQDLILTYAFNVSPVPNDDMDWTTLVHFEVL